MADILTEKDLKMLPRWACVAFASRCAARVQPIYRLPDDLDLLEHHVMSVDNAIKLSGAYVNPYVTKDKTAKVYLPKAKFAIANTNTDVYDAAAAAKAAAAAAARAATDASNASQAASYAAAFTNSPNVYAAAAAYAYDAYVDATAADADATKMIMFDYQKLKELSNSKMWDDSTPVDHWKELGPLWPEGEPDWFREGCKWHEKILGRPLYGPDGLPWLYEGEARKPTTIPLEIEIPDDMSDEEAAVEIKKILKAIDQHHRALGGSGIKVNRLQVTGIPVYEGAPS